MADNGTNGTRKPRPLPPPPKRRPILKKVKPAGIVVHVPVVVTPPPDIDVGKNGVSVLHGKKLDRAPKFLRAIHVLRQQAGVDYIADPDGRSINFHYHRDDREYKKTLTYVSFSDWSKEDHWVVKREQFWREVEARVLAQWQEKLIQRRFAEIDELTEIRTYYSEYMRPLKDKDGKVRRDEESGLPVFGLDMPRMDRWIRVFLEVDERLMTKRGEATQRTESSTPEMQQRISALDPVTASARLSPEDLRAMSREILRRRQPELADVIPAPPEDVDD